MIEDGGCRSAAIILAGGWSFLQWQYDTAWGFIALGVPGGWVIKCERDYLNAGRISVSTTVRILTVVYVSIAKLHRGLECTRQLIPIAGVYETAEGVTRVETCIRVVLVGASYNRRFGHKTLHCIYAHGMQNYSCVGSAKLDVNNQCYY